MLERFVALKIVVIATRGGGEYESSSVTSPLCRYDMYETWVLLTRLFVWFCKSALANIKKSSAIYYKRNLKKMITCFKAAIRSRGYRYFRDQFYAEVITECIPVHKMFLQCREEDITQFHRNHLNHNNFLGGILQPEMALKSWLRCFEFQSTSILPICSNRRQETVSMPTYSLKLVK